MDNFLQKWRPSANIQRVRSDPLRQEWLNQAAFAPDEWRMGQGLAPLSPQARDAVSAIQFDERPEVSGDRDWFGLGRPSRLNDYATAGSSLQATPPTFKEQSGLAALGEDIANVLQGLPARNEPLGPLSALGARPLWSRR